MENLSDSGSITSSGEGEERDQRPHKEYQADNVREYSDDEGSLNFEVKKEKEKERPYKALKPEEGISDAASADPTTAKQPATPTRQRETGSTGQRLRRGFAHPTFAPDGSYLGLSFESTTFTIKGPGDKYTRVTIAHSLENQGASLSQAQGFVHTQLEQGENISSIETSLWDMGYIASVENLSPAEIFETLQMANLVATLSSQEA
jgi:hypothetical protein